MSLEQTALVLAWLAIVVIAFAVAGLSRQLQLLRISTMRVAPDATARIGPDVGARPRESLPAGVKWDDPTLLLFLDADCDSCQVIHREIGALSVDHPDLHIVAVYSGKLPDDMAPPVEFLRDASDLFDDYGIGVTPFGVMTDSSGVVLLRNPVASRGDIENFITLVKGGHAHDGSHH